VKRVGPNRGQVRSWLFIFIIQPDAQIAPPPGKLLPRSLNHASNSAVIVEDKGLIYKAGVVAIGALKAE
jgi:hypothetical protein